MCFPNGAIQESRTRKGSSLHIIEGIEFLGHYVFHLLSRSRPTFVEVAATGHIAMKHADVYIAPRNLRD